MCTFAPGSFQAPIRSAVVNAVCSLMQPTFKGRAGQKDSALRAVERGGCSAGMRKELQGSRNEQENSAGYQDRKRLPTGGQESQHRVRE